MNPQMTQAKPELLMYAKTHKLLSLDFEIWPKIWNNVQFSH
jgi:hypothetical protein